MVNRRPIQEAHERTYVQHFVNWLNHAYRSDFKVVDEPNPPEAVIRSSKTTRWVEVSTAFWNGQYAKDLYSHATPGEAHKPVGRGPFHEMDAVFASNFVSVVKKKLEKRSYIGWRDQYGPGYLIVPIKHPWFDSQTVESMRRAWATSKIDDLGCFRSVYMAFQSANVIRLSRWRTRAP